MTRSVRSTYRLQLQPSFTFDDAAAVVPYLAELGVSHLYLSPCTEAVPGSEHGYDGVDPTKLRAELGGEEGFRRLVAAAHARGMGLVVDLVPHHLAAHATNPWWWALLAEGQEGPAADVFDVDWNPPERHLRHRVLLPVLADHYGRELEAGRIRLRWANDRYEVTYGDLRLPVSPESAAALSTS
ncbi:MAG: alpha-amylase family glycosyl hydrolase, partial [Acidimicrobiales bacterium]